MQQVNNKAGNGHGQKSKESTKEEVETNDAEDFQIPTELLE